MTGLRCALPMALAVLAVAGCTPEPRTQVMLIVDAEPGVRSEADALELGVYGGPSDDALSERATTRFDDPAWPVEVALVPEGNDASRRYRIVARALEGTRSVIVAEVRSGYVARQVRALRLVLRDGCRASHSTCAPEVFEPEDLPPYERDAGTGPVDGGSVDGGEHDAGAHDAGADDAGADDAGVLDAGQADAGPPDTGVGRPCSASPDCDDGLACNGSEICVEGHCVPGEPVDCGMGTPCNPYVCREGGGIPSCERVLAPAGTSCDDGLTCTTGDQCDGMGSCNGTVSCGGGQTCDGAGQCACPTGQRLCGGVCMTATVCCPGEESGYCPTCGRRRCRADGTGWDCDIVAFACTEGAECFGSGCVEPAGEACPEHQGRTCECDCLGAGCQWSACR